MDIITDKEKEEKAKLRELRFIEEDKNIHRGAHWFSIKAHKKHWVDFTNGNNSEEKRSKQDYTVHVRGVDQNMTGFGLLLLQCTVRKCKNTVLTN